MTAVQWIGTSLIALAATMFVVGWFSRKSREMDQHIAAALNDTEPRLHTEWSRLQAAVSQARADIAAEAEHFDIWEREVSA